MRAGPSRATPLVVVTGAFWSMLLAANLSTPLYARFSDRFGFSTAVLTLIFAVYALVLIRRCCSSASSRIASAGGG